MQWYFISIEKMIMNTFLKLVVFLSLLLFVLPFAVAQEEADLRFILSTRHFSQSEVDLEKIVGGRDRLIEELLEIRHDTAVPFAWARATEILLNYAEDPRVSEALLEDIDSEKYLGVARLISLKVDNVKNSEMRRTLARRVISRSEREVSFKSYAKNLSKSLDPEVRKMYRSSSVLSSQGGN